jgi:single-stranded-DNA-specific exonuclease
MPYQIRRPLSVSEKNSLSKCPEILGHLLFHRGISDEKVADNFLSPDYDFQTHDPFLLKDSEKAAKRIVEAIKNEDKIAVYADYDADGIPGAALFSDFFNRIGFKNFVIYIPHRHDEGFGVNEEAVRQLASEGVKLMITIDCGIADIEPIAIAGELGMTVIVTDHHEPPVHLEVAKKGKAGNRMKLPPAFAVIDHKRSDCGYPDKNLCGSAVAFKLIQAILKIDRFGLKDGHEKWLLDLVGIATLSDMVPLTGENRVFAHYGLAVLRKSPRKGLLQLFNRLRMNQRQLTEDDIAFMITPRINAASRMGVPMDAFHLLAADNEDDAYKYAKHLDEINNERKGVVASLVKEIKKTVRDRHGEAVPSVIVLGNPAWRPALLGLAANSCAEEFNRPVFLWGRDGDNAIKGSCRSEGRTHVVELMRAVPPKLFSQFGGHRHSGGFAVDNDQIHFLEQELNEAARRMKNGVRSTENGEGVKEQGDRGKELDTGYQISDIREEDYIDAELTLGQVNLKLFEEINRLAPFGVGNPKPVFLFKKVAPQSVRKFGKTGDHVELVFNKSKDMTDRTAKISAISFFGGSSEWAKKVKVGQDIDLIASLEKSTFMGRTELRMRVVDVVC